jgi:hypothetical protein
MSSIRAPFFYNNIGMYNNNNNNREHITIIIDRYSLRPGALPCGTSRPRSSSRNFSTVSATAAPRGYAHRSTVF